MIRMVFFTPYPEILPTIEQVFRERPDRDELEYKVIQNPSNPPLQTAAADADVVIARGFTARTMEELGFVCAELKVTGLDLVSAVSRCLKMYPKEKNIAVIGAYNMIYETDTVNTNFTFVRLTPYPVSDKTEVDAVIQKAVSDGNTAVIGGYAAVEAAKKYNIPAVLIESGRRAVNNAISEAKAAVGIARREMAKSSTLSEIMNCSFQGIIAIDRNGKITMANSYCDSILETGKCALVGCSISDFFPDLRVTDVIEKGIELRSELHTYRQYRLMVNCVPVANQPGRVKAVLTFQNTARIQDEEDLIRKSLHCSGYQAKYHFSDIFHQSTVMDNIISDAQNFSHSDSNILIYGETGTGKELFVQSIHNASPRKDYPFVTVNCAALPEDLLERELFGCADGTFGGTPEGGKKGLFEVAHKGTLFLDEIGDISPSMQSHLLRVLQEQKITRLGSDTAISVDVRIISATNRNLKEAVAEGSFRQDLLYRLNVLEFRVPPLRERGRDVQLLLNRFLALAHETTGCVLSGLTYDAMELLCRYSWPGNIREMSNFCERLSILCRTAFAGTEDVLRVLPDALLG